MRRHGFLAVAVAGIAATCTWILNHHDQLDASEEPRGSFREAFSQTESSAPVEDENGIRLNYFEAPWDKVLQNVAEQADLTLVADKLPGGRYARRDRRRYEIDSAINLLNAELEPKGFRLFQQGNFLIALKLDAVRTKYARPVMTDWQSAEAAAARQPSSFVQTAARNADNAPRVAWAQQTKDEAAPDRAPERAPVREVDRPAEPQPFAATVRPTSAEPEDSSAAPVAPAPSVSEVVQIQNGAAGEIARSIYLVFESRAVLVKSGIRGLPTFVVRSSDNAQDGEAPLFQVGIDQKNNRLHLEASQPRVQHLKRLITELDKPKENNEADTVRLVPSTGVSDVTARDLNEQIHRMVAMRQAADEAQGGGNAPPGDQTAAEGSSLNLRGEVNVQAMQDLGILILKGNETDVEKVAQIIAQLEQMSVGSLPDIHLLMLNHVNSEAMAELLTTVYDELTDMRNRSDDDRKMAAFIPVVQPNAVLILSPAIELEAILQLADQLDRQTPPDSEFKVFSLRNAIASQVATNLESFYEERSGLGTRIRIVADVRTNAVIVQGRPNDLAEVAAIIEKMDIDEPGAVHRVEVVQLRHATAEELAETISTAIQSVVNPPQQTGTAGGGFGGFGGNQGAQELQDGKSVALEFLSATAGGRELLRSGILVDVRVNPDVRSNSLIVSAPEASMPLLLALIAKLDAQPSATAEIKVFALRNADAEQSVNLLTAMFEDQNQEDQLGVQIAGTEGSTSSLIPVTFTADIRTNTVLAVGSAEALSVVEAILLRLDTTESRQRRTAVIPLRNAQASIVAEAIATFLEQQQELRDSQDDLLSNIERLRQEVIVAPDNNSNSLIVEASPEYYSQITQIIQELDATPPQVVIQALLVEVQLDNTDEFGVELGFQDPTLFSRSIIADAADLITIPQVTNVPGVGQVQSTQIITQNPTPGFNFNNTLNPLGNNAAGNTSTVATQGISNFSLGRQNGDLGFGGFVFSAQSDAVSVLVRALAARRTVHVLSRPQIRTTDNNTASIEVGQQVPIVDGVTVTDNFVTPNITPQNVGIIMEVTPRVTPDGTISMDIYAEKSAVAPGGVPVFTDVTTGNVVESVIIDTAIADTVVSVPNGQTIVIGGMITKSDESLSRKVPWLGDLPVVGNLFRYDGTTTARTELLIFLTPRIIYSDADSELIKQVETERMHFIESEAEEIHGPIYSVPPSGLDCPPGIDAGPGMPLPHSSSTDIVLPPQTNATDSEPAEQDNDIVLPQADDSSNHEVVQTAAGSAARSSTDSKPSKVRRAAASDDKPEDASWIRRLTRRSGSQK